MIQGKISKLVISFFTFSIFLFLFLINTSNLHAQSISLGAKPITGTFLRWDYGGSITSYNDYNSYFDELRELGMDTVIIHRLGYVISNGDCSTGPFTSGYDFPTDTFRNIIRSAMEHDMNIFLGGPDLDWRTVCYWSGDINNPATAKGYVYQTHVQEFDWAKGIVEGMGYDFSSPASKIKGFYIVQEKDVVDYRTDTATFNYFKDVSSRLKQQFPNKKILVSPYQQESHTYQQTYDAMYQAVRESEIDIYSPQDSVGVAMVTTYQRDYDHFSAMKKAIEDANRDFGKSAVLWANVETFSLCTNCFFKPADFKTLRWQIRAVSENVQKTITWIHNWGMYTVNTNYYPTTLEERRLLKSKYQNKPLIIAAFQWNFNNIPHMFIKSFNVGDPGDLVGVYVHYYSTDGTQRTTQVIGSNLIYDISPNKFREIRVSMNQFINLDWNRPIDIAVQNKEANWSYYKSTNPESNPDPSFPEISPFPQPTVRPTNLPITGDINNDGVVNIQDYVLLSNSYGKSIGQTGFNENADLNSDNVVNIQDFQIMSVNYD